MNIKIFSISLVLIFSFGSVFAKQQKCIPPKKFKQFCNKVLQSASGGGGGGSQKESGMLAIYNESTGKKSVLDKLSREKFSKSYQDVWDMCKEGVKKLDQQCGSNNPGSSCHQRNVYMNVFHQIGISHDDEFNDSASLMSTGKDLYTFNFSDLNNQNQNIENNIFWKNTFAGGGGNTKDLVKAFRKEMGSSNLKLCKDKESRERNGSTDPRDTVKGMQNKKDSPTSVTFKSKIVPKPSNNKPWDRVAPYNEDKETKIEYAINNDPEPISTDSISAFIPQNFVWNLKLQNLFLGKSFAAKGKESALYKNIIGRFDERLRSGHGPKSRINEYAKNVIQTNRNHTTQGLIDSLQSGIKDLEGLRNHQTRMTNDIQGEGMAAAHERFEKTMEMDANTSKALKRSLDALAFLCKNQSAKVKCWGDSNTPPQLPFPFGGGGGSSNGNQVSGYTDYPFVARYFCPAKNKKFSLKTKEGVWASAIVVSPKGIVMTHKKPLQGFEFHEKGCLVSIKDDNRAEKFQVYQARPEFYTGTDERGIQIDYDLMFFIPEKPHVENGVLYGVEPKERDFYHLFNYLDDKQDECTPYRANLGEFITLNGFELPDVEDLLEMERKNTEEEGFVSESEAKTKKVVDISFAARLKHEGYSGGAVIRDDEYCFAGVPYIRKIGEEEFDLKMIPLPEVLNFVSDAMGVEVDENSDFSNF